MGMAGVVCAVAAPLQNSRSCLAPLTQLWASRCIGISRRLEQTSTATFPPVIPSTQRDQRTGRIDTRHHAYHCRQQVRPLRGPRSEVSLQLIPPTHETPPFTYKEPELTLHSSRFTKEEFEDLCFDFGIELDEDTEEDERPEGVPPELKIGQSQGNDHCAKYGF